MYGSSSKLLSAPRPVKDLYLVLLCIADHLKRSFHTNIEHFAFLQKNGNTFLKGPLYHLSTLTIYVFIWSSVVPSQEPWEYHHHPTAFASRYAEHALRESVAAQNKRYKIVKVKPLLVQTSSASTFPSRMAPEDEMH